MSRSQKISFQRTFNRGLITEFSGLNFPEDAVTTCDNVIFSNTGEVYRRLGMDAEDGYNLSSATKNSLHYTVQEYVWENPSGNKDISLAVAQIGQYLHFWKVASDGALSASKLSTTINLDTRKTGSVRVGKYPCEFVRGYNGYLYVVHPFCDPFYITFSNSNQTVSAVTVNLKVRDLEGLTNRYGTNTRPAKNTILGSNVGAEHIYNLLNQGWGAVSSSNAPLFSGPGGIRNVLIDWIWSRNDTPSNADIWWGFKNYNGDFDLSLVDKAKYKGTSLAPRGHYIYSAFNINRLGNLQSLAKTWGISNLLASITIPNTSSGWKRPSSMAFYSGRNFYAGVDAEDFSNKVFFSRIITSIDDAGQCYQSEDPTSENTAGLLPDDGGVIVIPEISSIVKMIAIQGYLLVFATNGIWTISGSSGVGFRADDYTVERISDVQSISAASFVVPKSSYPIWWNADGIFTLQPTDTGDGQKRGLTVLSLTDSSIRTFFRNIPKESKEYAKGAYSPYEDTIRWVYRSEVADEEYRKYEYDRILTLNLQTGAFYPWSFDFTEVNGPKLAGVIAVTGVGYTETDLTISDESFQDITDASEDDVIVTDVTAVPLPSVFKYITTSDETVTFSQLKDDSYTDMLTLSDGYDFDSTFTTGYVVAGDGLRPFQSPVIFVYMDATEGSSCFMQGLWDFTGDDSSGRETTAHQVFIDRSFYNTQRRKIRLRGRGFVLQLKFFSEATKPFKIQGWSSLFSVQDNV